MDQKLLDELQEARDVKAEAQQALDALSRKHKEARDAKANAEQKLHTLLQKLERKRAAQANHNSYERYIKQERRRRGTVVAKNTKRAAYKRQLSATKRTVAEYENQRTRFRREAESLSRQVGDARKRLRDAIEAESLLPADGVMEADTRLHDADIALTLTLARIMRVPEPYCSTPSAMKVVYDEHDRPGYFGGESFHIYYGGEKKPDGVGHAHHSLRPQVGKLSIRTLGSDGTSKWHW